MLKKEKNTPVKYKSHKSYLNLKLLFYIIAVPFVLTFFSSCLGFKSAKRKKNKEIKTAIATARKYTGTKYKWGGTSHKGVDCSGLMYLAWKGAGKKIPRTSKQQSKFGKPIKKKKLANGDMVFFRSKPSGRKVTHVGMVTYTKNNKVKFIHASSSRGVVEDNLWTKYWKKRYLNARRVVY